MQSNESKTELVVAQKSWEGFLTALESFMSVHQRSLRKLRELDARNKALRLELRQALELRRLEETEPWRELLEQVCRFCGNRIQEGANFCDQCGRKTMISFCACGRILSLSDKFCDGCGRSASIS